MTLQEAKDEIANRYGYDDWMSLRIEQKANTRPIPESYYNEAAELYARSKWDQACEYYENNTPILPARKPEYSKLIDWD